MVKTYLRYSPSSTLGVIVSPNSNILCASSPGVVSARTSRAQPTVAIVPALESIKVWNVKSSTLLATLYDSPSTAEVTALAQNPARPNLIAAGYEDGSLRLWNMNDTWAGGELVVTFNGHKSAITVLCFDGQGNRLASGSRDTDVVLWDVVSEEGIARLRSHQDQLTGLSFLNPPSGSRDDDQTGDYLFTAGKDGLIKLWDLATNFCMETHLAHQGEVWATAVSPAHDVVVTAGPDGELKFWDVKGPVPSEVDGEVPKILLLKGSISRANRDKPLSLKFHPSSGTLATHSSNRNIEVFRIRSAEEIKKSLSRKRKRKGPKSERFEETPDAPVEQDIANQIVAYSTIRAPAKVRSIDWSSEGSSSAVQVTRRRHMLSAAFDIS
jgi:U3 small nucleolar RNA-associated protein 12